MFGNNFFLIGVACRMLSVAGTPVRVWGPSFMTLLVSVWHYCIILLPREDSFRNHSLPTALFL